MYHTTGPVLTVHFGIAWLIMPPVMVQGAATATVIEPSANAATAAPLTRIRMRTAFREAACAKRGAPARYCKLEVARRTASRARATAAASAGASPLAYAFDTSGNATLA